MSAAPAIRLHEDLPSLHSPRLVLCHTQPGWEAATLKFFEDNREHFAQWDPPAPPDFFTEDYWRRHAVRAMDDYLAERAVRFDLFEADQNGDARFERVIGRIGFSQIFRGPFQSCMLGYQIDCDYQGRGLMREALRTAIDYMFAQHQLHRIQANHRPENGRSAKVLQALGFRNEGLAREYLFIAGAWRDHVLNALINPKFDSSHLSRS